MYFELLNMQMHHHLDFKIGICRINIKLTLDKSTRHIAIQKFILKFPDLFFQMVFDVVLFVFKEIFSCTSAPPPKKKEKKKSWREKKESWRYTFINFLNDRFQCDHFLSDVFNCFHGLRAPNMSPGDLQASQQSRSKLNVILGGLIFTRSDYCKRYQNI